MHFTLLGSSVPIARGIIPNQSKQNAFDSLPPVKSKEKYIAIHQFDVDSEKYNLQSIGFKDTIIKYSHQDY